MPSKIDQNLLPPVIRESVDPDILNRAQSIEWSINRDTGEDEHGYLDGSNEDYLSSQNLMPKFLCNKQPMISSPSIAHNKKKLEWSSEVTNTTASGRDSGFEYTPTSPSLGRGQYGGSASIRSVSSIGDNINQRVDLTPLDDSTLDFAASNRITNTGSMKRHPQGQYPFPIYKVNQEQLQGDVVFEVAPRAKPGERTVHYEKSTRVMNEQDLNALGLDPKMFGPNSRTTMDEQEEELIETSVLKGGRQELEDLYNSMRTGAGDYFDRQRARSVSPVGNRRPIESEQSEQRKTVIFGSVDELNANEEQEFYAYRRADQSKPLPGDNEYGTWGSRFDEQKQWKLCNGQWVRVAEPKPKPKQEQYLAEKIKCKEPKKIGLARAEPVRQIQPQGSTDDSDSETDADADLDLDNEPVVSSRPLVVDHGGSRSPPESGRRRFAPVDLGPRRVRRQPLSDEPPVDLDALRDKYRPKVADTEPLNNDDDDDEVDTKANSEPTGTILLEPIRPPTPPLEEIKVEPIQPTYVEMKKPLKKPEGEEEKMMEDPNLMWMRMGPAQYGPPFGSMKRRKAREEEWVGPPCELCHKQIEERRCMLAENMKFHCWHFACSFCLKTLKPADFLIAEADRKPYCLNCHKREFPEISLVGLKLEEEN